MENLMNKTIWIWPVGVVLLLSIGCTSETNTDDKAASTATLGTQQGELAWSDQPRAPTPPEGFSYTGDTLFGLDQVTPVLSVSVLGHGGLKIEGRLANAMGQRSLYLVSDTEEVLITEADWLSPPIAAVNEEGELLVCYNRFIGETSQLTQGMLPDPTQGVHAICRNRKEGSFEREVRVGNQDRVASWLKTLNAQPNGQFRLHYLADDGWLMDASPKHHFMAQVIDDGMVVADEFVRSALDPAR